MNVNDTTAIHRARASQWRRDLAAALYTRAPLNQIDDDSLRAAIERLAASGDPRAWIWRTVCGAELARRAAEHPAPAAATGTTAAELAWREQQEKRAAA